MIKELDKEKEENVQAEMTFAQNLKSQIAEHEKTLDKLLDLQLSGAISIEEYAAKKQKILNQKIEISEKLKDFERQGNRWLERTKNLILAAHQANFVALGDNFSEKKNYLEKVGSNPRLAERAVSLSFKNDWQILAEFNAERRSREATFPIHTMWLRG